MPEGLLNKQVIEVMNERLKHIHPCDNQEIEPDACKDCFGIFVDGLGDVCSCGHIKYQD